MNFTQKAAIVLTTGGIVLSGGVIANANTFESTTYETMANLNVRTVAGTEGKILKTLSKGTKVKVIGFNSGKTWAKIGDNQWVSANYIKVVKANTVTSTTNTNTSNYSKEKVPMRDLTVTASSLNIRKGPGTNYPVVGSLTKGAVSTSNYMSGSWYEIGTNKWIHKDYVTVDIVESMNSFYDELVDMPAGDEDQTRYVNVSKGSVLNVRYTRALGGSVKDKLPSGKSVIVINTENGVSYIKYTDAKGYLQFGYVADRYLSVR